MLNVAKHVLYSITIALIKGNESPDNRYFCWWMLDRDKHCDAECHV